MLVILMPSFEQLIHEPEPQYLFTIDIQTYDVKPVKCPIVPIEKIVIAPGNRFFCQTAWAITECELSEDAGIISLKRISNGINLLLGLTSVRLIDVVRYRSEEFLFLIKDKYYSID